MSNLEPRPAELVGSTGVALAPVRELLPGREVVLGGTRGMPVLRTLPNRDRRMVGAWCFVDHFGPDDVSRSGGMRVPPHPHTGLQTVTWLVEGEVRHRDSIGSDQLIRPGQLNLMTAGRGIAHAEESPAPAGPVLHGLQLWVALPAGTRAVEAAFEHHGELPRVELSSGGGVTATVLLGQLAGAVSPATTFTPIVGAELTVAGGAEAVVPLDAGFEYAALCVDGPAEVDGVAVPRGTLLYLGAGRSELPVRSDAPARLVLLGGEPFAEEIVMWWNFIARTHDEIVRAREDWMAGRGFGTVHGFEGDPLPAPVLPGTPLKPRGRVR